MNNDNHKTLQEFAMSEIIKELRAERDALKAEIEELKQKTSSMMGVGSGAGNLFVYGDYDSIKAAQTLLLQAENDRAELEAARKQEPCGYMCEEAGITTVFNAKKCVGEMSNHTPVYKSPVPALLIEASVDIPDFTEEEILRLADLCQQGELVRMPAQQSAGPIAFTENDLLEIASSYSAYAGADGDMYLNGWVKSYEAKGFISLINNRQRGQVMAEQLLKGGENER